MLGKIPQKDLHMEDDSKKQNFTEKIIRAYYREHSQATTDNGTQIQGGTSSHPVILSVGGGKGGIGKSFISANVALRLAMLGYKVAAIDLDLGAANLHTCLGMDSPKKCISDFIKGRTSHLEEIGVPSLLPNLMLYSGSQEFWQQIKPQSIQKIKLINNLQELDVDYVLIDLGAGTHVHTLDFFIFSDSGILILTPEPTSIENAYVFMKSILYRKLQNICRAFHVESELEHEMLSRISNPKTSETPFSIICGMTDNHPILGHEIQDLIHSTNISIIINQVRTREDRDLGESMSTICNRYFGFSSQFLGSLKYDDAVWKSIRIRRPLILDSPQSIVSANIFQITDEIIRKSKQLKSVQADNAAS